MKDAVCVSVLASLRAALSPLDTSTADIALALVAMLPVGVHDTVGADALLAAVTVHGKPVSIAHLLTFLALMTLVHRELAFPRSKEGLVSLTFVDLVLKKGKNRITGN